VLALPLQIAAQVEEQLLRALAGAGAVDAALDTYRERLAAGEGGGGGGGGGGD
jgi:hypothetical protein